ncbi:MAG TPA: CPBP family intramembrane glutamic endopeptidase [Candidatus Angelobacter sp.]|nr:CPBP family intramembrane glutamic endopeptidase [Candidatus Angelobacter sp.]
MALAAVFSLVICFSVVIVAYAAAHGGRDVKDIARNAVLLVPAQTASYILTVGFMVLLVWARYRTPFLKAVRWNMPATKLVWAPLLGGSALALVSALLNFLLRRWIPDNLPITDLFKAPFAAYALAAFGILVAPLVEELFFRGFLYPALARWTGSALSIFITAGLFALLHGDQLALAWAPLLIVFVVGSVLTVVRARTNSVATCVLIHMGYNFTLFTMLFFATDHFHHMEKM